MITHDGYAPNTDRKRSDALVMLLAEAVDDLEQQRISTEHRLRSLEKYLGTADTREGQRMQDILTQLKELEKQTIKDLERAMSSHALGPFVERTYGVGYKQAARFLGTIGDPATRDRPYQLFRYCGFDVQNGKAPTRGMGQKTTWNPVARSRVWLIADSVIKHRKSPYRTVYDDTRRKYADAVHQQPCVRCGPKGRPAPAGSPLNDGHKHARALRAVAKAFLLDLWREARKEQGLPHNKTSVVA